MHERTHSFGHWLRRRRRARDLTQKALADAASCSEDAIRKIEADERRPSRRLAERLAERLAIPAGERTAFLEAARALRAVDRLPMELGTEADSAAEPTSINYGRAQQGPNAPPTAIGFVGRQLEMDTLHAALEAVVDGRGQLAMLAGEPGIGKTRTASELAAQAVRRQALVLWGRCYEGSGAPPFWPWVQVIRSYVEDCTVERLQSVMGTGAAEIAELVPEVRPRLPQLRPSAPLDPEQARFRLFDAIVRFLRNGARVQPLVLILEDLHWADQASLRFLEFLASELAGMRVLVIGTYRDIEISRRHPLSQTLAELTRQGLSSRLTLRGLSRENVEQFIHAMVGNANAAPSLIDAVHRQTEGNPLFVTEVVRLLSQEGGLGADRDTRNPAVRIPEGVREVIGRRLDRLSPPCNECLTSAAVIGRQFTLEQLCGLMPAMTAPRVLDAIEEALAARIIEELPRIADQYQFTHALIGETLAQELSTTRRVRMHARIGAMLEALYGARAAIHAAELAHHFAEAVAVSGSAKLIQYALLAGEQALAAHAHEQALAHFERALAAKEGEPMDAQTAEILFGRGRAAMIGLERHRFVELVESQQRAFDYFVSVGNIERAVDIADSSFPHFMGVEGTMTAMIDRALELVVPDSIEAARLLVRKGRILGVSVGDDTGAQAVLRQALEIARRENDSAIERRALVSGTYAAFFCLRHTDGVEQGLRAIDLAERAQATDDAVAARYFVTSCLRHLADVDRMRAHADALQAAAKRLRNRFWVAGADWLSETVARMEGDWARARSFSDAGLALSPNDIRLLSTRAFLEYETGEMAAGDAFLDRLVASVRMTPPGPIPEYGMACGVLALSVDVTGQHHRLVVAEEFAHAVLSAPTPALGVAVPAKLTLAVKAIDDQDRAVVDLYWCELQAARHPLFLPGTHCFDRFLGRFAGFLGRVDDAIEHFDAAVALCRRIDYRAELAWSLFDFASFLNQRNDRGDLAKSAAMLAEARELASALGMKPLEARIVAKADRV